MIPTLVRKFTLLLVLFTLCLGAFSAGVLEAQVVDLDKDRLPVAPLPALWRFHAGDDPAWADPKLDDSGWSLLKSDRDWSSQGYKGHSGFGWYRFRVLIPAAIDQVSFTLPPINTSYEVFADGRLIGRYGGMPPNVRIDDYDGVSLVYRIPRGPNPLKADQRRVVIAIRVWVWPTLISVGQGGGPIATGGIAGDASQIESRRKLELAKDITADVGPEVITLLDALAALGLLTVYLFRRRELEYLWFGLRMLCAAIHGGLNYATFTHVRTLETNTLIYQTGDVVNTLLYIAFFVSLLQPRRNWFLKFAIACAILEIPGYLLMTFHPTKLTLQIGNPLDDLLTLGTTVWMMFVLVSTAIRRSGTGSRWIDARLLLLPFVLRTIENWSQQAGDVAYLMNWDVRFPYGVNVFLMHDPLPVSVADLISLLWLVAVFAILVLRFARTSGEEERYAAEVEGARHVQQFLIPEDLPQVPGLTIESDYRPAREVGGDFFQIIPDTSDGSALVLVGDVAGKGMQAGMLATLLVGSMRTAATFTRDPAVILSTLNNRLCGKGNATCLALRIEADGRATLVNAGHLPPYCNGVELPMEGALPLGTIAGIEFPILHFQINPGDTLTLISDGILEAQKADGELFGFERITELLAHPSTASSLANAAQDFGQEDDITVLTIARRALPISLVLEQPELQM